MEIKGPKEDLHIFSDPIYNKDAIPTQWEKNFFSNCARSIE